jgi:hypothetical protein
LEYEMGRLTLNLALKSAFISIISFSYRIAVGMPVARHPPYRSVCERLIHTASTLGW